MEKTVGKKTLDEAMQEMDDNTIAHIGSKTMFFFIGTKAEYEHKIDTVEKDLIAKMKSYLETGRHEIKTTLAYLADPEKSSSIRDASEAERLRLIGLRAERLARRCVFVPAMSAYLENYKPIRQRKVKDFYRRLQNDGICIIVTGSESASYWYYSEFLNDYPN